MFSTASSVVTSLTITWRKPQRRQWFDNDIYMPSIERMGIGDVVVAVDTSGSVATHELQQFLGELNRISEDHKPRSVTVITRDAHIQSVTEYGEGDVIEKIECNGRGGTRVEPVFKYIRDHALPVDNMVYLTDMGIWDFPDNHPHYELGYRLTPCAMAHHSGRQHHLGVGVSRHPFRVTAYATACMRVGVSSHRGQSIPNWVVWVMCLGSPMSVR